MKISGFVLIAALTIRDVALGFSSTSPPTLGRSQSVIAESSNALFAEPTTADTATATDADDVDVTSSLFIPITLPEMVQQTSQAMRDAYDAGMTRQIVRILLPRNPSSLNIGELYEAEPQAGRYSEDILVPTDESWQGGIMQLYRAAAPTCEEILRSLSRDTAGVPPKVVEDRSVDESGVDGVGVIMTQSRSPKDDVSCFVQPTQETIDAVESISGQAGERLVAIMNPQWRQVDDALDVASKGDNLFGNLASFLGGKGNSLKRLDSMGFKPSYTLEGYVCKGGNVRLIKRFDSDWAIFAETDSGDDYVRVGTSVDRPSYQDVDKMLDDNGISLKYARDLGLAPKL